jgi:hypothetical protein
VALQIVAKDLSTVIASEAKQSTYPRGIDGLLRRFRSSQRRRASCVRYGTLELDAHCDA